MLADFCLVCAIPAGALGLKKWEGAVSRVSGVVVSKTVARGKFASVLRDVPRVGGGMSASVHRLCPADLPSKVLVCLGRGFFLSGTVALGCLDSGRLKFAWLWGCAGLSKALHSLGYWGWVGRGAGLLWLLVLVSVA